MLRNSDTFRHLVPSVVPLRCEQSTQITIPACASNDQRAYGLCVTLLPAGHCFGSVMFLFDTRGRRVLFTGDMRLSRENLRAIRSLHDSHTGLPLHIDSLYLDTTFVHPDSWLLPARKTSAHAVVRLINEWFSGGGGSVGTRGGGSSGSRGDGATSVKRLVYLSCAGRYGAESLFG